MIAQACGKVGVASIAHTCAKGGVPLGGSIHDLEGGWGVPPVVSRGSRGWVGGTHRLRRHAERVGGTLGGISGI